jgi:hypothetical protein
VERESLARNVKVEQNARKESTRRWLSLENANDGTV